MNGLKVEVREGAAINEKSGTSGRGRAYTIIEQEGFCTYPNGEIRRVQFGLETRNHALPPGTYEPKADAFYPGDFGSIAISMRAKNWQRVEAAAVRAIGAK